MAMRVAPQPSACGLMACNIMHLFVLALTRLDAVEDDLKLFGFFEFFHEVKSGYVQAVCCSKGFYLSVQVRSQEY